MGGGIFATGSVVLHGVILSDNTSNINRGLNCAGEPPKSRGYNFIQNTTDCGFAVHRNTSGKVTDIVAADPLFEPLFLGETSSILDPVLNVLPMKNSPLVNKVPSTDCPLLLDLQGKKRDSNCDIGAIERQGVEIISSNTWLTTLRNELETPVEKTLQAKEKIGLLVMSNEISIPHRDDVSSDGPFLGVLYSPDGHIFATGGERNSIQLLNANTGEEIMSLVGHNEHINSIIFSKDGHFLATASEDGTSRLWNIVSGHEVQRFTHSDPVKFVDFTSNGQVLVTASDKKVIFWDLSDNHKIQEIVLRLKRQDDEIARFVFGSDGTTILIALIFSEIQMWNTLTEQEVWHTEEDNYTDTDIPINLSLNGRTFILQSDGIIDIRNATNGQRISNLSYFDDGVSIYSSFALSPNGKMLALINLGNVDGLSLLDLSINQRVLFFNVKAGSQVVFSPDGRSIAVSDAHQIHIYKSPDDEPLFNN